jgi:hypothetical protein
VPGRSGHDRIASRSYESTEQARELSATSISLQSDTMDHECAALLLQGHHGSVSNCRCQLGKGVMQYFGNREPTLDEVLDDPIVRLVMARDQLTREEVQAQIEIARQQLWNRQRSTEEFV